MRTKVEVFRGKLMGEDIVLDNQLWVRLDDVKDIIEEYNTLLYETQTGAEQYSLGDFYPGF